MYAETGAWSEISSGVWSYTHGDDATAQIPWLSISIPQDTNWSEIKYISANVTVNGTAAPAFGGNVPDDDPSDEDWYNCDPKKITDDTVTIYLEPDGKIFDSLEINFGEIDGNYATAGAEITISGIYFSTEERDYSNVTGEWYKQNGNWYYRNGNSIAYGSIPALGLDANGVDWSQVEYISADVTVSGKACPVIGGSKGIGNWVNGTEVLIDGTSEAKTITIYMNTNNAEITDPCIEFWWCSDNEDVLSANALITVSNIVFSTVERDYSNVIGEWYSPEEGKWCFNNGTSDEGEIPCLNLDYSSVDDWSAIKYISAKVEVDNKAIPVVGGMCGEDWIEGTPVYTENGSNVVFLYTDGKEFVDLNVNFFTLPESSVAIPANTKITVSEITFSTTYPTNYSNIVGQWVKTGDGQYYYNHTGKSDIAYVEGIVLDCPYNIGDVQSISITARVAMTGGTPKSIKLTVAGRGITSSGEEYQHPGYNFPFGTVEETVVRKYRGAITARPSLDISFGKEDLAVIANGGTVEIFISDISYSTDRIDVLYSTPNDLMIDDNETDITGDDEHDIMYQDISRIEKPGTLKIYTENIGNTQDINVFWREWSDFSNITTLDTTPVAVGDGVYEIKVTQEALDIIHKKSPYKCELALTGTGYRFIKAYFTPDPDATMPVPEEITPDSVSNEKKAELQQSSGNTIDETRAPESADDFAYGKAYGHKSGLKKNKHGDDIYALRIVQRVEKRLLQHAESVTITVYSRKADQYITLTADTCFSYLNINGFKVKANNHDAFLTVLLDNIPEDDEITFTSFTINYKK